MLKARSPNLSRDRGRNKSRFDADLRTVGRVDSVKTGFSSIATKRTAKTNLRNAISGCSGICIRRVDWTTVVTVVKHVHSEPVYTGTLLFDAFPLQRRGVTVL